MACMCAPALLQLRDEVNARWPKRDKASDGCCASPAHSSQNPISDHEPGAKGATPGYAHAEDIDENLNDSIDDIGFLLPVLLADSRTKYCIYWPESEPKPRIWYPDGTSKIYTGLNDHAKHLHISIKGTATFETRSWLSALDTPTAPTPPEDDIVKLSLVLVEGDPQARVYLAGPGAYPVHVTRLADYVKPGDFTYVANRLDAQLTAPPNDSKRKITDGEGTSAEVWIVANGRPFGLTNTGERL